MTSIGNPGADTAPHAPWCDPAAGPVRGLRRRDDPARADARRRRRIPAGVPDAAGGLLRSELSFAAREVEAWTYAFDGDDPSTPLLTVTLPNLEGETVDAVLTVDEARGLIEGLTDALAVLTT